jgi:CNT family concentrative nucleoside transporter
LDVYNLVSLAGLVAILGLAWVLSENRRVFNWRVVLCGIGVVLVFGVFLFVTPAGRVAFLWVNLRIKDVLDSANAGSYFVFGPLSLGPGSTDAMGQQSIGFILATQAFPAIVFFSALISILYYCGIMQKLIGFFAWFFAKALRLSGAESLCAASDIFVGIEASLTVRPHLREMTRSELNTILTTGMASVSSNVMLFSVLVLQKQFPMIAGHLASASLLAIPASLVVSKILVPETESPKTSGQMVAAECDKSANFFEAVIDGAMAGVKLVVGIVALLLAVVSLVALLNLILGGLVGYSLQDMLAYLFAPLTLAMGVPPSDVMEVSRLVGERLVLTEVTAYQDLAKLMAANALQHPRSAVIAAYALCGFAHLPSMAIFVGGIAALAPERKSTLASLGPRALLGATLATLIVGCVAGACFAGGEILLTGK